MDDQAKYEGLVRELRDALVAKNMAPDRVTCQDGHLRIDDAEAYAALQGVLADHDLVEVRHLDIAARIFSVDLSRLPEAEVKWRFMTHTGQVSDIVQFLTLDSTQAQALRQQLTQNGLATQLGAPRLRLTNGQRGNVTIGPSKAHLADHQTVAEGDRSRSVPQVVHAMAGHSFEICPHLREDGTLTVNVTGRFSDLSSDVTQSRSLRIGTGPATVDLPLQQPTSRPSRFDVQFRLSSNGSILFTRHDLVAEPSGAKPKQIHLVMLDVTIAQQGTTLGQP